MSLSPQRQQTIENQLHALGRTLAPGELLWASGYFAGLAASGAPAAEAPAPSAEPGRTLAIWYGSETGNGRGVAQRLADAARANGYVVDLASLDEVRPRQIGKLGLLLLVISTHGEGDPPEGSEAFHEFLLGDRAPRLNDLRFGVFALGDSSYPDFCQTGRELDARLEALGATRLLDRVDCDVDFETQEDAWRDRALEAVKPLLDAEGAHTPNLQVVRETDRATVPYDRRHPFHAEVLERSPLTVAPSNKRVAHIELSIAGSGLSYEPGDSLGIWPSNDPRTVEELIELIGLEANTPVTRDSETLPLETWLTHKLELTQVVRPFLQRWAEWSQSAELAAVLDDRDALQAFAATRQVADVLREYPVDVTPEQLVTALRRIAPRLYSIASSPLVAEDEVHLTVKLEGGEIDGRLRAGVASWQLLETARPGDTLPVYIEANERFRLPADGNTPIIMIGPGTGVAPFRAFVEHRKALGHAGPNWLFFGEQHRKSDFLYQLEWQRHKRDGILDRLSVAFSRDQADKVYVQHRLREQGAEVHGWLERGAHVYVCGNGQGMAADVHAALADIVAEHGGRNPEQAEAYLQTLKSQRRYQKDVY